MFMFAVHSAPQHYALLLFPFFALTPLKRRCRRGVSQTLGIEQYPLRRDALVFTYRASSSYLSIMTLWIRKVTYASEVLLAFVEHFGAF